jgi:hypothetical protein
MGRVLIITIAAVIGALGTWFFIPTVQSARINPDAPVFSGDAGLEEKENTTVPPKGVMSDEKRRTRAEQLVGKKLKYITDGVVHSQSWFTEQGVQVIERAMDECFLVTTPDLYLEHISQVSEGGLDEVEDGDKLAALQKMQPTFRQIRNCAGVYRAYAALHDLKVDF